MAHSLFVQYLKLRFLLLPIGAILGLGGLAIGQWASYFEKRSDVEEFIGNSVVHEFHERGYEEHNGRGGWVYDYLDHDSKTVFATHRQMNLPASGLVRLGAVPLHGEHRNTAYQPVAAPLNGPDNLNTIYREIWGHPQSDDLTKASVVSVAALMTSIAAVMLFRKIAGKDRPGRLPRRRRRKRIA